MHRCFFVNYAKQKRTTIILTISSTSTSGARLIDTHIALPTPKLFAIHLMKYVVFFYNFILTYNLRENICRLAIYFMKCKMIAQK